MPTVPRSAIIVPLYLYPVDSATWQPLHQAVSNYPDLHFVVIINPNSGPGVDPDGWLPDKHYSREIPRLTERANVTIVGYVRVDYCRRPVNEVLEDIRKYANWSTGLPVSSNDTCDSVILSSVANHQFSVRGIFFDEVPNIWKSEDAAYLEDAGILVKKIDGILGDRLIFHNTGTVPDPEFPLHWQGMFKNRKSSQRLSSALSLRAQKGAAVHNEFGGRSAILGGPDITVVFEESSALWHETTSQARLAELLRYNRESCSYMIHSVPEYLIRMVTKDLRIRGGYLFVTELRDRYYESFGKTWEEFVSAMAAEQDEGEDNVLITIDSSTAWIKNMARDTLRGLNCPFF